MATTAKRSQHERRLNLRLPDRDADTIEMAASVEGQSVSAFMREAALQRSRRVLANRTRFVLEEAAWEAFSSALDAPVPHVDELARMLHEPTVLDRR